MSERDKQKREEALKAFNEVLSQVTEKMDTKPPKGALNEKVKDVKDNAAKAKRGKQLVLTHKDKDGVERQVKVGKKFLQALFNGALYDCMEQCGMAYDTIGELMDSGMKPDRIAITTAYIFAHNIGKAIDALAGETKLTPVQRQAQTFLNLASEKFAAFDGMDSTDPEVQAGVARVMFEFICAFNHVLHFRTKPKYRLKVINDYRHGRTASFMKPVEGDQEVPTAVPSFPMGVAEAQAEAKPSDSAPN